MIRRLLLLVVVGLIAWLIRSAFRSRRTVAPRTEPAGAGSPMVRDRICNTYLPRARAITLLRDGQEHHFCSETCRARFLQG